MATFEKTSPMPCSAEELYAWHARPGAFERLTPPWSQVSVEARTGGIEDGALATLRMGIGPLSLRWVAEHRDSVPGVQFRDVQLEGPFARWEHTHHFEPAPEGSVLRDHIDFELPLGGLGALVGEAPVRRMLERMFTYRHRVTRGDLLRHATLAGPPMHVLVTGASGLVGQALVAFLSTGGHNVRAVVRGDAPGSTNAVRWNVERATLEGADLDRVDAVIHLAGENVAGARWTPAVKQRILESRSEGTRSLCDALLRLPRPPRTLVSASAVGFYGNRADEVLDEDSERGRGFLSDVCEAWEAASEPLRRAGLRTVHLRIGVVLSAAGGALAKMLPVFQLGGGGRVGRGTQYMSWIALDDLLGAFLFTLRREDLEGAVNAVAPDPVTNAEFTAALARVLHRPALLPVPAAALRLALGEMADEMLLASTRAVPARLREAGFAFAQPDLEGALRHTLGRA